MAKLVYAAITSLDGYVNDADGGFEWAAPDADVHAFFNDLDRPVGTHLYGRRMWEVMEYWATAPTEGVSNAEIDYAHIWQGADKVVYSRSLPALSTPRTTLERDFDAEDIRRRKAEARRDLSIGGPTLAAQALAAGLVDELQLVVNPVVIGGGTPALPDGLRLDLELADERRFTSGVVFLRYRVR